MAVPPELHVLHTAMRAGLQVTRLAALSEPRSEYQTNALPVRPLRVETLLFSNTGIGLIGD